MKFDELLSRAAIIPKGLYGRWSDEVADICYDSRLAKPGSVFIAISGLREDGHRFASDAYKRGARGFVVDRELRLETEARIAVVESSRTALAKLAAAYFNHPSHEIRVVGITGTNGKTTTSYLLQSILQAGGRKSGRLTTIDYDLGDEVRGATITTPESLDLHRYLSQMRAAGAEYACMEVSSHALKLGRVQEVTFAWAVFTNLSPEHLDFHSTMEDYLEAKLSFFRQMPSTGKSLVNIDDPVAERIIAQSACPTVTYGTANTADYRAILQRMGKDGTSFFVEHAGQRHRFHIWLPGRYNMLNALGAIALGREEGLTDAVISKGLQQMKTIPGRLELVSDAAPFAVYVDYAHTPDSLQQSLQTVRTFTSGRLILVFGCGGDRDQEKRPLMGSIAANLADFSVITSDNPRSEDPRSIIRAIEAGLRSRGAKEGRDYAIHIDRCSGIEAALHRARSGDCVLVAGKGHEKVQILSQGTIPFDDRLVIRRLLKGACLI